MRSATCAIRLKMTLQAPWSCHRLTSVQARFEVNTCAPVLLQQIIYDALMSVSTVFTEPKKRPCARIRQAQALTALAAHARESPGYEHDQYELRSRCSAQHLPLKFTRLALTNSASQHAHIDMMLCLTLETNLCPKKKLASRRKSSLDQLSCFYESSAQYLPRCI